MADQALHSVIEAESDPCATELGAPLFPEAELRSLLRYPGGQVPTRLPTVGVTKVYNPVPMLEVEAWMRLHARRVLIVDGALSPWNASDFGVRPADFDEQVGLSKEPFRNPHPRPLREAAGAALRPASSTFRPGLRSAQASYFNLPRVFAGRHGALTAGRWLPRAAGPSLTQ